MKNDVYTPNTGVLKIGAEWCGPCKRFNPIVEEVKEQTDVEVVSVDIDESNSKFFEDMGIKSVPTMVFYKEGEEIYRLSGLKPATHILKLIEEKL